MFSGHHDLPLDVLLLSDDLLEGDDGAFQLQGGLGVSLDLEVELIDSLVERSNLCFVVSMETLDLGVLLGTESFHLIVQVGDLDFVGVVDSTEFVLVTLLALSHHCVEVLHLFEPLRLLISKVNGVVLQLRVVSLFHLRNLSKVLLVHGLQVSLVPK